MVTRAIREKATERFDIVLPISFTSFDVGITPIRLFQTRLPVSSVTFQAGAANTGRVHIGVDSDVTTEYGYALSPGTAISWEVTLADIFQVLGWDAFINVSGERFADQIGKFRQPRVVIDAGIFWAVATLPDQDLTISYAIAPRF